MSGLERKIEEMALTQILARQSGAEAGIYLSSQNLYRLLLVPAHQLPVGRAATQLVHDSPVALLLQLHQQPPDMPLALSEIDSGSPLRGQPFLGFFNATNRSRSCCVTRSVPEATSPPSTCQ